MRDEAPQDRGVNTTRYDAIRLLQGAEKDALNLGDLPVVKHPTFYAYNASFGWSYESDAGNYPKDPGVDGWAGYRTKGNPISCAFAPSTFSPGGLVWGAAGFGKSRFLMVLAEQWTEYWGVVKPPSRRLTLIDPKAETFELIAMVLAAQYLDFTEEEREGFVPHFRVHDVLSDHFTPANLFGVPPGMSASLVAEIRAGTMLEALRGENSELVEHGVRLLFQLATALGIGLTMDLVRAVLEKRVTRERMIVPKIADGHLRERVQNIESTLPEQSRLAIVRRFEILLAERSSRLIFGISPASYKQLLGEPRNAPITLHNYGASFARAPKIALAQAMDAVVSAINEITLRSEAVPDMLIIEESAQLVRNATVARYLQDASRMLRWKGIALVCCAQDPTNAFPSDVLRTLALNSRWYAAFQCLREDAALFETFLPTRNELFLHNLGVTRQEKLSDSKRAFYAHMASLPQQHCIFLRKGLSAVLMKTQTVHDFRARRDELLATFYDHIASRSMVRFDDAERVVAEETQRFFTHGCPEQLEGGGSRAIRSVDDLLKQLDGARARVSVRREDVS